MGSRFFLPLMIRLAVVAAGPLAVGWWLVGPIGGGAAAVVLLSLELWRIDRTVRTAADDRVTYTPTPPGDLTWLDEDAIRQSLRDLRSAGFQPIADCTFRIPVSPAGFTRVLTHRGERVYACVAQGRRGTHAPEAVAVTLLSALDDGRTLTTTSSQPTSTMAFGLERTDAWQIRPGAAVHDLIVEHLATRARLAERGPTGISGDGTLGNFVAMQTGLFHRQAQECRMNGALGAIRRGMKWERHGHKSWVDGVFSKEKALIARPLQPAEAPAPQTVSPDPTPPTPGPSARPAAAPKPPAAPRRRQTPSAAASPACQQRRRLPPPPASAVPQRRLRLLPHRPPHHARRRPGRSRQLQSPQQLHPMPLACADAHHRRRPTVPPGRPRPEQRRRRRRRPPPRPAPSQTRRGPSRVRHRRSGRRRHPCHRGRDRLRQVKRLRRQEPASGLQHPRWARAAPPRNAPRQRSPRRTGRNDDGPPGVHRTARQHSSSRRTYLRATLAPASSRSALIFSASSLFAPSLTLPGAPSTRSFASFRPSPVT